VKIVTWNCNCSLRSKKHLLDDIGADLIIVQECEDPSRSTDDYRDWAGTHEWIGENEHKGLGVFARGSTRVSPLQWPAEGLHSFLPCQVNDQITLVAVWTKGGNSIREFVRQSLEYIELHKEKLAQPGTVLCGDFNSNSKWDHLRRKGNHSHVVSELRKLGIHSMYHELTKERQGEERTPTFYLNRKVDKPYHLDYVFASSDLICGAPSALKVGTPDLWLEHSDHMPIIVELDT
jgi:endonuclease/exonuclease/phosphatase family metal-dependent hydrolase